MTPVLQAVCVGCWNERYPDDPKTNIATLVLPQPETCCYCGEEATSGLYEAVDPDAVPHFTDLPL
jgi:hypothetical protein